MVTKAQFDGDPYQRREVVTAELDWLGDELCRRTGRPRMAAGTKGDWKHLRGAHRSNDFIDRSPLCTSRGYTFQAGLTAEQERHIAGFDFTPGEWGSASNRALMKAQTARLRSAMLDGRLAGVREVIGTLDGRTVSGTRADGGTLSSDTSHLDHWHLTFDRRRCRDKALMERIVAIALGDVEDDVTPQDISAIKQAILGDNGMQMLFTRVEAMVSGRDPHTGGQANVLHQRLLTLPGDVVARLVDPDTPDEQVADALRQLLADRPGVLELLAAGT